MKTLDELAAEVRVLNVEIAEADKIIAEAQMAQKKLKQQKRKVDTEEE